MPVVIMAVMIVVVVVIVPVSGFEGAPDQIGTDTDDEKKTGALDQGHGICDGAMGEAKRNGQDTDDNNRRDGLSER
jgi:hypothetical protein